jgi:hypothetical protein
MSPPSAVEIEGITDTESILLPGPLTAKGIAARRAQAGKLVAGTAASTSSDFFKGPVSCCASPLRSVLTLVGHRKAKSQEMGP